MADLVVPPLGESITEAVVAVWLKQVGDAVAADEPVAELETDKITVQLPSPVAGAIAAQKVPVGATVKVGDVIGSVEAGTQDKAAVPAQKPAAATASASAVASSAAAASPGSVSAPPAARAASQPQVTLVPPPAPVAASAAQARPAAPPAPVAASAAPVAGPASGQPSGVSARANGNTEGHNDSLDKAALLRLTPSQRVHAREVGTIPHTGAAQALSPPPAAPGPSIEDRLAQVDPRDEVVAMSPLRKRVAERLVQAQHEAASLTTFNEVDMTQVMELRGKYKDSFEKTHGVKLGFMSFFVRACVAACKMFPGVNAEVIGGNIVYKKHYDFGIAVGAPKGLVVPVLRDCDALSFAGIEKGILALADKARGGKLALADLSGGTFSITNGGIYGSMMSTPLLNYPQTGILGMHNIVKRAVVVGDEVKVRPMMYVALSYDHRVVDGREAVSFLVAVKDRLEAPDRMLVEV